MATDRQTSRPRITNEKRRQFALEGKCQLCEANVPLEEQYTLDNDLDRYIVIVRLNAARPGAETKSHYCATCKDKRLEMKRSWLDNYARSKGRLTKSAAYVEIPIEVGRCDGYEIVSQEAVLGAERLEWALVDAYRKHLEEKGDTVVSNLLTPTDGSPAIRTDLLNLTRSQLIEAKVEPTRNNVRMAIGQLADYQRFIVSLKGRAVLLNEKPSLDLLSLLDSQGIAAVWRTKSGFADTAEDGFV